jgi:hypothetical protein
MRVTFIKQIFINIIVTSAIIGLLTGISFLMTPNVLDVEYDWNMWVWMEFAHCPLSVKFSDTQHYSLITGEIHFQKPRNTPNDPEQLLRFILRQGSYQSLTRTYHVREYLVVALVVFIFVTVTTIIFKLKRKHIS